MIKEIRHYAPIVTNHFFFHDIVIGIECCGEFGCKDYRGTVSITENGKTCQAWNVQQPHKHKYGDAKRYDKWNNVSALSKEQGH